MFSTYNYIVVFGHKLGSFHDHVSNYSKQSNRFMVTFCQCVKMATLCSNHCQQFLTCYMSGKPLKLSK